MGVDATRALSAVAGSQQDAVFAQHLDDAANDLDSRLAQVYVVPFNAITAATPTPGIVSTMTYRLTAASLLIRAGQVELAAVYLELVEKQLNLLVSGDAEIPGATKVDAGDSKHGISYSSGSPAFSGREDVDNDNTTDTGRMDKW